MTITIVLAACSTTHYRQSADREAYRAIGEKTPAVPGMDLRFTIEQQPMPPLDDLPVTAEDVPFLGEAAETERNARVISLEKALALAVKHSRTYQNEKESLYLQALALTLNRHQYTPIFSGTLGGTYSRTTTDVRKLSPLAQAAQAAPDLVQEIGDLAGTPADLLNSYAELVRQAAAVTGIDQAHTETVDERSVAETTALGVDMLLKGGGRIAVDLTTNFLRFLTGDPRVSATSALAGSITQPLLRGAGRRVAAERLTQAERDLLYALRDFARFRQQYTVQICTGYYGVLQDRDVVRNSWQSYQSFVKNTERERALRDEGKVTETEVGRLEQALLSNENGWIGSIQRYKQHLDQFKIEIGLSTDAAVVLDDNELRSLKERGILHPNIALEDAVKVAQTSRLDLYSQRDKFEDAGRKVHVAANALKPDLNLVIKGTVASKPNNRFQNPDFERSQWSLGVDVGPPWDRKAERNNYRAAVIGHERAKRDLDLAEDKVKLDIRDGWRSLDQAKRAYEIAMKGVELNKRRVEEQDLLAELGRATALNRVDAQNDLTQAEDNLTAALLRHTIARLQFWRDMGILFIKESGQWEEITDDTHP
jgi:outer membrane protein TolC